MNQDGQGNSRLPTSRRWVSYPLRESILGNLRRDVITLDRLRDKTKLDSPPKKLLGPLHHHSTSEDIKPFHLKRGFSTTLYPASESLSRELKKYTRSVRMQVPY